MEHWDFTSDTGSSTPKVTINWKPVGRGRRFDRLQRGLARRLRIPFVRRVLYERDNPQIFQGHVPTYGPPWNASNAGLANFSFACTCHPNERYSRKGKRKKWRP